MSAPPAIPAQSEASFQRSVVQLARTLGWRVGHVHDSRRQIAPGRFVGDTDAAGLPDLILVRGGRLLFVELKADKGRLRPQQAVWLEALAAVAERVPESVGVRIWKPRDWADIKFTLGAAR
jgi:hypothetical protein